MILRFSPSPEFSACSTKRFEREERHVTRLYGKSVLILMMDGELNFYEDGVPLTLTAGEYYIQRQGLFQEGIPNAKPPIYFYVEFLGTYSEDEERGVPLRGRYEKKHILPILEQFEYLFKNHEANPFLLNSYMNRIFSELWVGNARCDEQMQTARLIRNDLDARYAETVSVEELGYRFGYTADHVTRIFKKRYSTTPHQYQIKLRMEHARWLLENTNLGVERVADAVGYRDFSAFYRAYRKAFSVSPRQGKQKYDG